MHKFVRLLDAGELIKSPLLSGFYSLARPAIDRTLGFDKLSKYYQIIRSKGGTDALSFCSVGLEHLGVTTVVDPRLVEALSQRTKPTLILANHPYGCIDSLSLMKTIEEASPARWKFLSNKILKNIRELHGKLIIVDPFAKGEARRENLQAMREMLLHLKSGGIITMFPARRVSAYDKELGQVCDLEWSSQPFALVNKFDAEVLLIHIDGHNSQKFLKIPSKNILRRSLRLAKEIPIQTNKQIKLTLSAHMNANSVKRISKFKNAEEVLRAHGYIGADRSAPKPRVINVRSAGGQQGEPPINYLELLKKSLEPTLEQGSFASFFFQGKDEPEVLHEIGRLREVTFQSIGAGSGNRIDVAEEDEYYHHIVVVDTNNKQIAGAYRVGFVQDIIKTKGSEALYLDHVFEFKREFYDRLGNAMELSRSFICPNYQKSPVILDLLWRTVGAISNSKGCRKLFGSVTVSSEFTPLSQAVIVDTLDRFYSAETALRDLVSNDKPFTAQTKYHSLLSNAYQQHGIGRLGGLIEELEEGQRTLPPLIRYYASLGAKFISFKVEPTFNDAIYCLLLVDVEFMPKRYRSRFF